jgi:hypothetical protein
MTVAIMVDHLLLLHPRVPPPPTLKIHDPPPSKQPEKECEKRTDWKMKKKNLRVKVCLYLSKEICKTE